MLLAQISLRQGDAQGATRIETGDRRSRTGRDVAVLAADISSPRESTTRCCRRWRAAKSALDATAAAIYRGRAQLGTRNLEAIASIQCGAHAAPDSTAVGWGSPRQWRERQFRFRACRNRQGARIRAGRSACLVAQGPHPRTAWRVQGSERGARQCAQECGRAAHCARTSTLCCRRWSRPTSPPGLCRPRAARSTTRQTCARRAARAPADGAHRDGGAELPAGRDRGADRRRRGTEPSDGEAGVGRRAARQRQHQPGRSGVVGAGRKSAAPPTSDQRPGPTPLRDCINDTSLETPFGPGCWQVFFLEEPDHNEVTSRPDSLDGRMQQVWFVNGNLWGAAGTGVSVGGETKAGIAWFAVTRRSTAPARWRGT